MAVAVFGYVNDQIMHMTYLVGNHFPIGVFGPLLLLVLVINPLLGLLRSSWRLRASELAVILALVLSACSIPGSSMLRSFYTSLAWPAQLNLVSPGWRKAEVMQYVPPVMMPGDGVSPVAYHREVMDGYLTGLSTHGEWIHPGRVPWDMWRAPLMFWGPLLFLFGLAVVCMSLIVHSQWSHRERLRYPVVDFAASVISGRTTSRIPLFRCRSFYVGLAIVLGIHAVNGLQVWVPETIGIPLQLDFWAITTRWPELMNVPWGIGSLLQPQIYLSVVAFSFFLVSDVSFSLGVVQFVYVALIAWLLTTGVDLRSDYLGGGATQWQLFGSGLGVAILVLYVGRRYYGQVIRRAFAGRAGGEAEPYAAWALRILVVVIAALAVMLVRVGLEWYFAVASVLLILLLFLVTARANAESGLFYFQAYWHPFSIFLGLFGAAAFGPKAMVIVGMLCTIMTIDPRECLMPFIVTGLKVCDDLKVPPARVGTTAVMVFAICMAVALPAVLWMNYNSGVPQWDGWANRAVPSFTFRATTKAINELKLDAQLGASRRMSQLDRLLNMKPERTFLWAAGIGLALAVGISVLRLRHTWWPIHPICLLVAGTAPGLRFGPSFLLGWAIKSVIVKFGGGKKYQQLKPLMIGVIAGELFGGLLWMIVGAAYRLLTGLQPKAYWVYPL